MTVDDTLMCSFQIIKANDKNNATTTTKTGTGTATMTGGARPGTPGKK
jgi:hypothetical protein